jgi:hypothetical protein
MQHIKLLKRGLSAFIVGVGALAAGGATAADVNMWDGQWHFEVSPYAWVPFIYTNVNLPQFAGGGNPTIETQPSQYLKYLKSGLLLDGTVRRGDASLWTDFVYLNLSGNGARWRQIGLPGGDPIVPVSVSMDLGIRASIWTVAPTYTVMNNDIGTLDLLAGIRYTSAKVSLSYVLTAGPLQRGGGTWPTWDSTDILFGVKGSLRLSHDGKWFLPYEADIGDGSANWQWNAMAGVGYHFHWGDAALGVRNLNYHKYKGDNSLINSIRFTGPVLGASFRW